MNENFYKDIMIQNYQADNYYDPTKLFVVLGMLAENKLKEQYSIYEITKYVYRYYLSNYEIAKHNLNLSIRKITRYGISDIMSVVENSIKQWMREQKHDSIKLINENVYLSIDDYSEKAAELTYKVCQTLFLKYYKVKLQPMCDYSGIMVLDDKDVESFGKSEIKKLIFEDIQYCPLCENTQYDTLYATHILLNDDGLSDNERITKDNLLLMCKEEMEDYVKGKFYFNEFGKVVNVSSNVVSEKMRLSQRLMNRNRKGFIKRKLVILQNNEETL